jgi:hypothetical protein
MIPRRGLGTAGCTGALGPHARDGSLLSVSGSRNTTYESVSRVIDLMYLLVLLRVKDKMMKTDKTH